MATFYIDTSGHPTNSGSSDQAAPDLSGTNATGLTGTTITLDGSPTLTGLVTSGANQSTIYLANATATNRKIFKITGFDNTAKTVTVDAIPGGADGGSWNIGGRHDMTNATISGAISAGDLLIINSDKTGFALTARANGDNTNGYITVRGKTGVRPILSQSASGLAVIDANAFSFWKIENLELRQTHASSGSAMIIAAQWMVENVRITDAATHGITLQNNGSRIINCEITGCGGCGVFTSANDAAIVGCYIHDNGTHGVQYQGNDRGLSVYDSIIESNGGRGIYYSGTGTTGTGGGAFFFGNTIYGNGESGFEAGDPDIAIFMINNIFSNNGNAAGESNVKYVTGSIEARGYHRYNVFHNGSGADAPIGLTLNSTELTSDPLFVDPANGNFNLQSGSPARGVGFPGSYLGNANAGFRDIGALQHQDIVESGGSGGSFGFGGSF